eukprot:268032-Chlamydomonas_euryale.AAC.2
MAAVAAAVAFAVIRISIPALMIVDKLCDVYVVATGTGSIKLDGGGTARADPAAWGALLDHRDRIKARRLDGRLCVHAHCVGGGV